MLTQAHWGALSVVLIVVWGHPPAARACPHPCACYVPSEVHCTFRSLASVPAGISKHVERINLGFNSIQALSETSFAGLTKLELLMLHGNDIPSIPDGALRDLSALQVFKFSYNKVRVITRQTLQGLSSLLRLHMDHNQIEFIHPRAFQGLLSLRLLHLEGNQLHQLHPDTFSTLVLLDHFRLSTVRHLYLADNGLRRLPDGLLQGLPVLETLYLHGNPWACDCRATWLRGWAAGSRGVLKCKKDKAYDGGQLCATCSSPRTLQRQEILKLTQVACVKPAIESPLRQNRSHLEEQQEPEEEEAGDAPGALDGSPSPPWNISLNMTDEHRNTVLLLCAIKRPRRLHSVQLNPTEPPEVEVNATLALDLECPMTRENYERLWKLIAYYSEVPVQLHREPALGGDPAALGHRYRQDARADALYYTGVRARILARPEWVAQPSIEIQLDRRQSTASKVLLSYYARCSQTVSPRDARQARRPGWVMIEPDAAAPAAQTVLEGGRCQLSCPVRASESPSISWRLPDGSELQAPTQDPAGRLSVLSGGQLRMLSTRPSDSGLYQCVARVRDQVARLAYRVLVVAAAHQPPERDTVTVDRVAGDSVLLPCRTLAVPEAHVAWILPDRRMVSAVANTSQASVLPNGSLSIPKLRAGDGGYYRCVAANQLGSDQYTVAVTVRDSGPGRSPKRGRRPGAQAASSARADVVEDEGGSGTGEPSSRGPHPEDPPKSRDQAPPGDKKVKKGRRKLKFWKHPEKAPQASMAEGRRVFESRRRINVENKQINPERWADILARVRGKNLPRVPEGPRGPGSTASPPGRPGGTSPAPAASPPAAAPAWTAATHEGSSEEASPWGEGDQGWSPGTSAGKGRGPTPDGAALAGPQVTRVPLEEDALQEQDSAGGTEDLAPTEVEAGWVEATSPQPEPPAPQTPDSVSREPAEEETGTETWAAAGEAASLPGRPAEEDEPPLEAASLAESEILRFSHRDPETGSDPGERRTSPRVPPTPPGGTPVWLGEPGDRALSPLQRPSDRPHLDTPRPPPTGRATEEASQRGPGASRQPERDTRDPRASILPDPTLPATSHRSSSTWAGGPTPGARLGQVTALVATAPPSHQTTPPWGTATPSRRRPGGRRRSRPHKLRQGHQRTPASTPAPTERPASPLTPAPGTEPPKPEEGTPVPTPWAGDTDTLGTPKPWDLEKDPEPVSKGTPRRKNGKRPNKLRSSTSTLPTSTPSPTPESGRERVARPTWGTATSPATVPLKTGDPSEVPGEEEARTTSTETPEPPDGGRETMPAAHTPPSGGRETAGDGVTRVDGRATEPLVPGTPSPGVTPTSPASWVSALWGSTEEPPAPSLPGASTWSPPGTPPPTDAPGTDLGGRPADPPSATAPADGGSASASSASPGVSTAFPLEEEVGASTTVPDPEVAWSSSHADATLGGPDPGDPTVAQPPSQAEPQGTSWSPAQLQEVTAWGPATTSPLPLTLRTSPAPPGDKDDGLLGSVGLPETPGPRGDHAGTRLPWTPSGSPTPVSHPDGGTLSPAQDLGTGAWDSRHTASPFPAPQGPAWPATVHLSQPPAGDPARAPTPRVTPQGTWRSLTSVQPTGRSTLRPPATAAPPRVSPEDGRSAAPRRPGSRLPGQGTGHPGLGGTNSVPEPRAPPRLPGSLASLLDRTLSLPPPRVTPGPHTATLPAPVTRERQAAPGPHRRGHPQGAGHLDLGPPAPPRTPAAPPRTPHQVLSTPGPWVTSSAQASGSFPQSSAKLGAAGPAAAKFWLLREKPQITTRSPQSVAVTADTDLVFPCEATGKPKPFITWTKVSTGALMTPNSRIQRFEVLANGTLVIRRVQTQDRGQYMCTASNPHGVDKMVVVVSVTVQQPQILASRYQDVTVYLGDTIAMECLAKGTPVPQISWIFPDRRVWQTVSAVEGRITLHENRTLSIKEASFSDRGVYKCVASNAAGADSLAIRLHVAALPPVIQQEKAENISLPPGLSVHIHCSARAAPPASVRWVLWGGAQIRPSQFLRGNLFVFPNGTLYIRNLAPKDSGRYECVATNPVGTARRTVQLTVQRSAANARITGTSPRRTDVRYGGTLWLDCSAAGDPWPRILWRLPSKRMIDAFSSLDARVKVFSNGTLVVKSVTDKDAGDYLCVARNKVGDDYVVLKVNVEMKPAKIQHKEENDHRVFSGGDLKVDCVATGLPNPEISWSLPDGSLVNSLMQADDSGARTKRYLVFTNGTLYFNEVGPREAGDYTCVAQNQVGKDEMRVRVQVLAGPAALRSKSPAVVRVSYGEAATLPCAAAEGQPEPRVTWLSPTHRLIPASSDKYRVYEDGALLVQRAQRADGGNYTCLVRHGAGEDRRTVWLQVQVQPPRINGHPGAVATVREEAAAGSRRLIDCQARGIPAPRVLWAFPEGVVLPAPYYGNRVTVHRNGTLDLRSLRPSDSVRLACIARNEAGEARLEVQLTVREPAEQPAFRDPAREEITASAGHTISLNCSAAGSPPPSLLWVLPNGTELASGQRLGRFFHKMDGMLHVSHLAPADAGAYRCLARNAAGQAERRVSLRVGPSPEPGPRPRGLVSIVDGEDLRLHCAAPGARPGRFSWTLPGGLSLDGPQARGRVSLLDNGTLTVRAASVFDRGTYVCRAETEAGALVLSTPVIVVAYPPRITSEPRPVIYARPGGAVELPCMAMGIPRAEVTWELPDGSLLTAAAQARLYGNRYLHPQGSLSVQQVTPKDAGFYKCTARNVLGTDSRTTYVHVY